MNNILILNLGTSKDLIMSSHLISSFKEEYPNSNISIVTYKEHAQIAKILSGVHTIHTIDSDFMQNVVNNPLYSDAFALNQFAQDIEQISQTTWHKVINYSNDTASSYLVNALNTDGVIGTYINANGTAQATDKWSTYQNFVMSKMNRLPILIPAVRNHIAMTPMYTDVEKIKINSEYLFVANQNFTRIRQMNGGNAKYIIGINLEVGYEGQTIDENAIKEIIEAVEESEEYKTVLLTSGKSYQKEIVNRLNAFFGNSLITINVEAEALSSVITNIDALISTANNQMMIADALEIRVIEVKNAITNFKTPSVVNPANYVVYANDNNSIGSDIILALNEMFETQLPITAMNSVNPIFISIKDDYGVYFTQIRGELDILQEINYHLARAIQFEIMGYPKNDELVTHIKNNTLAADIASYSNEIKTELTEAVKTLLSTLRSLKSANSSKTSLNQFINHLDQLITMGAKDSIVGSIIRLFEGNIENISSTSAADNMKEIETNLFALKSNLQIVTNTVAALTEDSVKKTETKKQESV